MDIWIYEWLDVCMYILMDGWVDGWTMYGCIDGCMYVMMDECMYGWMHVCVDFGLISSPTSVGSLFGKEV